MTASWEAFLAEHFPGYLLPESYRSALPAEAAAWFLERLGGRPGDLDRLRAASFVAAHLEDLREFAIVELPTLARALPLRTEARRRVWEGRLEGALDVPATLHLRREGRRTELVARTPERRLDRLESVLLKSVVRRLSAVLARLDREGVTAEFGWSAEAGAIAAALGDGLVNAALRGVPDAPITPAHEQAAAGARRRGFTIALRLHRALRDGVEGDDPAAIARVVAAGALSPLRSHTRFELAVLLRLVRAIDDRLAVTHPGQFTLERALVLPGRREVASFVRDDGARVDVHYDQACFEPGAYDRGVRRYLGQPSRLRPDVTIFTRVPGAAARAAVVEVKLSSDPGYLVQGYQEATVYRSEFAAWLSGWPKAMLVAPGAMAGAPEPGDEVIAIGWDAWVPEAVLDGLLAGL